MRRSIPSIAAALAALTLSAPAHATGCPSLTDDAGDGRLFSTPLHSAEWDIVSADVATGPTSLLAVVRLADLAPPQAKLGDVPDPTLVNGTNATIWRMGWTLAGVRQQVEFRVSLGVLIAEFRSGDAEPVPVPVTFDRANDTISWSVPRADVPGLVAGATLSDLAANTSYWSITTDTASADGDFYTDGTPGCIAAP